jgi:hypothetical protein
VRGSGPLTSGGVGQQPIRRRWIVLQVDITNAFNTVKRGTILTSVQSTAPHLFPWAQASLQLSLLLCRDNFFDSTEGDAATGDSAMSRPKARIFLI